MGGMQAATSISLRAKTGPHGPAAFFAVRPTTVGLPALFARRGARRPIEEKAQLCTACHGENGIPQDKTIPVIWGQHQGYTYLQLRDYKSGDRKNDLMSPLAQALERDDMMALAHYFAKKRWPGLQQPPAPPDVAARAQRANVAVGCTGCHQGEYQGEGTQPRLAGQTEEYMQQSMLDFRTRKRGNNPGMSDLMMAISEEDIAACAEYLAGLQYIAGIVVGPTHRATASRARSRPREVERRFPPLSAMVRSAPRASRSCDDRGVAELGRDHQRRAAAIVDRRRSARRRRAAARRPRGGARADAVLVARRPHQRGQVVAVGALDIDAGIEQSAHDERKAARRPRR